MPSCSPCQMSVLLSSTGCCLSTLKCEFPRPGFELRLLTNIRHLVSVNTDMLYATSGLNINTKKAMLYHHSGYLQSVQSVQDKYRTCLLNLKANVDVLRIEYDQLILKAKDNAINILNIAREQGSPLSSPSQVDMLNYHSSLFTGPGTVQMAQASIAAIPMEEPAIVQPEPAPPVEETVQAAPAAASPPPIAVRQERQVPDLVRNTFTPVNTPLTNAALTLPKRNRGGARENAGRKRRAESGVTDTSSRGAQADPPPLAAALPSPPPSSRTDQAAGQPERDLPGDSSDTIAVANSESPTEILSSDAEPPAKRLRQTRITDSNTSRTSPEVAMADSLAEDREYWSAQYKKTRDLLR